MIRKKVHVYDSQKIIYIKKLPYFIFSSPELITYCLSVCPSICELFTFSSSSQEPQGQFQSNLAQEHLQVKGIQVCSNKGQHPFFQG